MRAGRAFDTHFIVTGIVRNPDGKILLLKKSDEARTYPGKWSFCSGHIKEYEAAEDTVLREIKEETGMEGSIEREGNIIEILDGDHGKRWVIACYLCSVPSDEVRLCHENTDFAWVDEDDIDTYDTVPGLQKDLKVLGLADHHGTDNSPRD